MASVFLRYYGVLREFISLMREFTSFANAGVRVTLVFIGPKMGGGTIV